MARSADEAILTESIVEEARRSKAPSQPAECRRGYWDRLFRFLGGLALIVILETGCAPPPAGPAPAAPPGPRPVLLTTDAGCEVDDQWALAMLVLASEERQIDLAGVVTTHAPGLDPLASLATAREVLDVLRPLNPPPVVAGSGEPLRAPDQPRRGLGPEFIVELSKRFDPRARLTVLSIGAATDLASALLIDPRLAERIEVVAMAFDGWPTGGDAFNVKNDPLAYRVILRSGVPLTIGSADVCLRRLTLDSDGAARKTLGGGQAGEYLEKKLLWWLGTQGELCRKTTGRRAWPIWDLITVAQVLKLTRSEEYPRPGLRDDLTFEPAASPGNLRWITDVDADRLWNRFNQLLARWNSRPHPAARP